MLLQLLLLDYTRSRHSDINLYNRVFLLDKKIKEHDPDTILILLIVLKKCTGKDQWKYLYRKYIFFLK